MPKAKKQTEDPGSQVAIAVPSLELPDNCADLRREAMALVIKSDGDDALAQELIRTQMRWDDQVDQVFNESRSLAHSTWKSITNTIAKLKAPMEVRSILDPKRRDYQRGKELARRQEEERRQREEQERIQRAANAASEALREARELADRLRREGEIRAAKEAQEAAIRRAQEEAALMAQSVPSVLPTPTPSDGGGYSAGIWEAEITNIRAVLYDIIHGDTPLTAEEVGDLMARIEPLVKSKLNKLAKRMGQEDICVRGAKGVNVDNLRVYREPRTKQKEEWF